MSNNDNLVRMANQIGHFFESQPDRNEGLEGLANHLKKFWDPRMRKKLIAMFDAKQTEQFSDIVKAAMEKHRSMLISGFEA